MFPDSITSELLEVMNAIRLVRERKPRNRGAYIRFRTMLDSKVCPICAPLNGRMWSIKRPNIIIYPWTHTHPNCRCVLEYEEWELTVNPKKPDKMKVVETI